MQLYQRSFVIIAATRNECRYAQVSGSSITVTLHVYIYPQ